MDNECLISVIIPIYNTEKYLAECIESVLKQTEKRLEIILVDDGSADLSSIVSAEFLISDSRIRLISKRNGGQSSARNYALDIACGDFIYFLDSDDYIAPALIESLSNDLRGNASDAVFFEAKSFYDGAPGQTGKISFDYHRENNYSKCKGKEQYIALAENNEYHVCVPLHMYRRSYLEQNNIRFREGIIFEDNLFSARIYLTDGWIIQSAENGYFRRIRPESTMTSRNEKALRYKYESKTEVYYELSKLVKAAGNTPEFIRLMMKEALESVIYAYKGLPEALKSEKKKSFRAVKRHALLNYGSKNEYIARSCTANIIENFAVRVYYTMKRKLK